MRAFPGLLRHEISMSLRRKGLWIAYGLLAAFYTAQAGWRNAGAILVTPQGGRESRLAVVRSVPHPCDLSGIREHGLLADGIQCRLVGPSAEGHPTAEPVRPSLEDGYVWLMKGRSEEARS